MEAGHVCNTAYHSKDELWLTISTTGPRKEENETWILKRTAQTLNSILPKHMGLGWRKGKMFNLIGSLQQVKKLVVITECRETS